MSRGRTGNKIWQLITFSWHTLLWIVNGTSDLIGQLDSREPIILLWSTHVTTRSTSETIQNLEEQHVIAKGTQMTKRVMVGGGGGGREEENGASVLCFFWHFLILFVHQSNLSDYSINRKSDACQWDGILKYWTVLFLSIRQCHLIAISTCPGDILQGPMETLKQDCKLKLKIK